MADLIKDDAEDYDVDPEEWFVLEDRSWLAQAACVGLSVDDFFIGRGMKLAAEVRAVCASCPVRLKCLEIPYTHTVMSGFFGGLSSTYLMRNGITYEQACTIDPNKLKG